MLIGGYQDPVGQSPYWENYNSSFTTPNPGYVPPVSSNPWLTTPTAGIALPILPQAATGNQVLYQHYAPQAATGQQTNTAPAAPVAPAAAKPAEAEKAKAKAKPEPKTVTVKGGDNLSKIAAANGTSWKAIYELNKDVIGGNPNLIRPGQVLKMP